MARSLLLRLVILLLITACDEAPSEGSSSPAETPACRLNSDCPVGQRCEAEACVPDDRPDADAACEGDWSEERLIECGERIWNLERQFNLAAGLTAADDTLPARLLEVPAPTGTANATDSFARSEKRTRDEVRNRKERERTPTKPNPKTATSAPLSAERAN